MVKEVEKVEVTDENKGVVKQEVVKKSCNR